VIPLWVGPQAGIVANGATLLPSGAIFQTWPPWVA
jgi:hypothetical protein